MTLTIDNELVVHSPTKEFVTWCDRELAFDNPEYYERIRLRKYIGAIPKKIRLYSEHYGDIHLPYGVLDRLKEFVFERRIVLCKTQQPLDYIYYVPLRDYQELAVEKMYEAGYGILKSPAGSGKTQMGLALAMKYNTRVLWVTHTKDLLLQSYNRACEFCDESLFGKIENGHVNIGKAITFALVQTLANTDLLLLRNEFDVIIVDECHRCAASPRSVTQFQKVLSNLSCLHKYGLTATLHRSDGLLKTTFALIGGLAYAVPEESVVDYVRKVSVRPRVTSTVFDFDFNSPYMNPDGTINYQNLTTYLTKQKNRNLQILADLKDNQDHYCIILSSRLTHLYQLQTGVGLENSVILDGSIHARSSQQIRKDNIDKMREGKVHFLFATYKLAKEGLDIPRADRLFLVTPEKDKAVVTQSIGRIARDFPGKEDCIVYDYVDNCKMFVKFFKERLRVYKSEGCEILSK